MHYVAAGLFALGAVLLVRSARKAPIAELAQEEEYEQKVGKETGTGRNAVLASFEPPDQQTNTGLAGDPDCAA